MKQSGQKNVIFRRIHGRVIPIRTDRLKELRSGAALSVAGIAAAAGAGHAYGAMTERAAQLENVSRHFKSSSEYLKSQSLKFPPGRIEQRLSFQSARAARMGSKFLRSSNRAFLWAAKIRKGGTVVSAALLGAGVNQALKATPMEKNEETRATAAGIAAGVGAFAFNSSYIRRMGGRWGFAVGRALRKVTLKV